MMMHCLDVPKLQCPWKHQNVTSMYVILALCILTGLEKTETRRPLKRCWPQMPAVQRRFNLYNSRRTPFSLLPDIENK
ncbi:hypothetical protein BD310DRAFT_927946 [Dichomitus squalens]|uniref:Uncharacterized protein n=1 Tax=Dichomitus squalens TaxID=114155 RepID=A0A4Q9PUA3_9APHY|nr:hypothetical protein BD310DRAFT_927946 [Dichomitus squalens]